MRTRGPLFLAAALLTACNAEPPPPPEALPSADDTVEVALASYDAAAFDTIAWETPGEATVRGSVVYSYSCQKCHGSQGYGDGGFVTRGDTLRPPSFHDPDWRSALHAVPYPNLERLRGIVPACTVPTGASRKI